MNERAHGSLHPLACRAAATVGICCLMMAGCPGGETGQAPDGSAVGPAHLVGLKGSVSWHPADDEHWRQAADAQALPARASLRTGPDGRVEVVFSDGRRLVLEPDTELLLSDEASGYELRLAGGEVSVAAGSEASAGFRMAIGRDEEMVLLRQGQARLRRLADGSVELAGVPASAGGFRIKFGDDTDVVVKRDGALQLGREQGALRMHMRLGEATITRGGAETRLAAGSSFRLKIGTGRVTARERVATQLRDRKRAARLRAPNATRFVRPGRQTVELEPGTAIRNQGRAPVELIDEAGGKVVLAPGSQATFQGSFKSGQGREGTLNLERGQARVVLRRQADAGSVQEIVTPRARVVASANGLTAEVTVNSRADETRVTVHTGRAEVSVGDQTVPVAAGQHLTIGDRAGPAAAAPVARPLVYAREGARTRVFSDRPIRTIGLRWDARAGAGPALLEASRSKKFDPLVLQEPVTGREFTWTSLDAGKTYWRLATGTGPERREGQVGSIELSHDPSASRKTGGKLTNVVRDTGDQTKVIFQGKAPALTFRWDATGAATRYEFKLYAGDDLENPLIQRKVQATRLTLPAGRLREGSYFWYQTALDAGGKTLHASRMNKLELAFDNATTLMRIDMPRPGARPTGGSVEITGLAPAGLGAKVNGRPLLQAADGRFDQVIKGVRPGSALVFRLVRPDLGEVYYLRHLGR